jgi:hypothetical protein
MNDPKDAGHPFRALISAAALYFGVVFGAGFVLGVFRVLLLVPRIGVRYGELAEMPLMFAAIYWGAGVVVRRQRAVPASGAWLAVGAIALGFMLAAEFLLAVALAGRSVGGYIAARDPVSGTAYLVMLGLFALMPWLRQRAHR